MLKLQGLPLSLDHRQSHSTRGREPEGSVWEGFLGWLLEFRGWIVELGAHDLPSEWRWFCFRTPGTDGGRRTAAGGLLVVVCGKKTRETLSDLVMKREENTKSADRDAEKGVCSFPLLHLVFFLPSFCLSSCC